MKKLTALFICIITLFSFAHAEIVDESFYVGTWVSFQYLRTGGCTISLFHLAEDHKCYFLLRAFSDSEDGHGRENIKTWSSNGNDLTIVTGNTTWDLFVTSDYRLAKENYGSYEIFEKVGGSVNSSDSVSMDPSAITVPSGVYVAGEDFPAGTYRIELADSNTLGRFRLYENIEKTAKSFSYLYEYSLGNYYGSTSVGKIVINEGNALDVRSSTIILLPYEGLK